ncbi:hypothetical protein EJ03DRAFT_377294 [Teratosphaeria nubilosa]|uniref:Luciferase domain-containing protein n=1 Tax=Teratosphaeria nubilosa TaxID=161662 RepID=A0A6G1KZM0_9PEZI|nr:hypothetical protein EJ03DRAFT_377294 [Teratosphaeria nubilosa]
MATAIMDLARSVAKRWASAPTWTRCAPILALPMAAAIVVKSAVDYHRWRAMGDGGPPPNVFGYLINVLVSATLAKSAASTRDLKVYDDPERNIRGWRSSSEEDRRSALKSYLADTLPQRRGVRAKALAYCVPQREKFASEWQSPKVKEVRAYMSSWQNLKIRNATRTSVGTSPNERHGEALLLPAGQKIPLSGRVGEIAHIHHTDLSGHVVLSLADAKDAVAKGWGERHRLSGVVLPLGYTMLYSPRTVDEVEMYERIIQAGVDYMTSLGKVEVCL